MVTTKILGLIIPVISTLTTHEPPSNPNTQQILSYKRFKDPSMSFMELLTDPETLIDSLPVGSIVVPFCDLYLGSYKVIPKRSYNGANG